MTVFRNVCVAMTLALSFAVTPTASAGGYGGGYGGGGGSSGGKVTQIKNKGEKTCLTAGSVNAPGPVTLAQCTNAENQKFVVEPAPQTACLFRIRLKSTDLCLADPGTTPGATPVLETCSATDQDQRWVIHQCGGANLIINGRTGGHLEATNSTTVVTDDIIDGTREELWKLDIKGQCKGGGKHRLMDDSTVDIEEFSDEYEGEEADAE